MTGGKMAGTTTLYVRKWHVDIWLKFKNIMIHLYFVTRIVLLNIRYFIQNFLLANSKIYFNNLVGIAQSVLRLATGWMMGVGVSAGAGNFSLHHRVQTGIGTHPASYPMGTGGSCPRGEKRAGHEADHSPPSSVEVKECMELYLHSSLVILFAFHRIFFVSFSDTYGGSSHNVF
jgi:hypothetical protein